MSNTSGFGFGSKKLRIVILRRAIATIEDPVTQSLFIQMLKLKREGYGREYPAGVLPLDASDFMGTHLMICETGADGGLDPIVAYRSVTLREADFYRMTFPPRAILSAANESAARLEAVLSEATSQKREISYDSAWTMRPDIRENREYSRLLRDITTTIGVRYHRDFNVPEWLTIGIIRFKTDQYFRWMGAENISREIAFHSSYGESAYLLHLARNSKEALEVADTYQELWDRKLVIAPENDVLADAA